MSDLPQVAVTDVLGATGLQSRVELERLLGLPIRYLEEPANVAAPETQALLRVLATFPWMVEVAEHKFDPELASLLLRRHAVGIQIEGRKAELRGEGK
jgi:hypothetical protein